MNISDIFIKKPVMAWMLIAAIILFGVLSLKDLGIGEMPDVDFPVVTVSATYRGAAPEVMESDVVDVIEDALMTVEGIRQIASSVRQEGASITIDFNLERDINQAMQDVQNKIAQIQSRLPNDLEPLVVRKTNPEDNPILWISLSADKPLREIITFARNQIKDRLQTVDGVGEVMVSGYVDPNLRLWLHPDKLQQYELTAQDVLDAIAREHVEIPLGRIETPQYEYNLRFMGEATPEEFGNILITKRGGKPIFKPIPLKEVATIELGLDELRRISRASGKTAVGLGIKKQRGYNTVAVGDGVKKRVEEIQKTLPSEYVLRVNFDSTQFIRDSIGEMRFELTLSAILTAIVCLLFLASFKSTFNILLAIPTSIIGAFFFMDRFGFTFNNFTFLGLTLAIGIVVDDAIMVLENIVRHQELKQPPMVAASIGAKEITGAAMATTFAVIAIFIPVVFIKGVIGEFFYQFGMVMSITVVLSLIEALSFTPMRSSRLLYIHTQPNAWARLVDRAFAGLKQFYASALEFCLNYRWRVITLSLLIFVSSLGILPKIKKELVPAQDQNGFLIQAQMPVGSSLEFSDQKMREIETLLAQNPNVQRFFLAVGGFGGGEVDKAMVFVTLKTPKERPIDASLGRALRQDQIMDKLRNQLFNLKDVRAFPMDMSLRGFTSKRGQPIEFSLRGPDHKELVLHAEKLMEQMKQDPYFKDVDSDYRFGQKEILITPLRQEALNRGVSIEDIAIVINAMIGGRREGKMTEAGKRDDIRLRLTREYRSQVGDIKKLLVRNNQGELVPLAQLVMIEERQTLQVITRVNRERAINISSGIGKGYAQQDAVNHVTQMAQTLLPAGYRIVLGGASETFKEAFSGLGLAMILGIIVAYMILASQYNSYIHPVTVLLALPFSVTGALLFLWVFQQSINIYSFIGLLLLMGIAKKNSILLVDFTNQKRRTGVALKPALLAACPTRLRPILMTSLTIIAAAIPTALGLGPGSEVRVPMSIVIIGGMLVSTLLTLFVIPCFYMVLARFEKPTNVILNPAG
ncbi:MAG: efflux RND transporter permease subunit [Deltaproteobacteria bacterium]|nr:efflux RND transporter permease subunit [Deltaproteobacteria bacterium]